MNRIIKILFSYTAFFLVLSCSTGRMAYNRGEYYKATMQASNRLRTTPDNDKAIEMIKKSYPMAIKYYRRQIDGIAASNSPDKFLRISDHYKKLNKLADDISRCPAALEAVKPVMYFDEQLQKAEEMAIKEQFDYALSLLKSQNLYEAREAYDKFLWVKNTAPGFKNIDEQLAIAKELSTLKIVVEQLPDHNTNYEINTRKFYIQIYNSLVKNASGEFVRFYHPKMAEELNIVPHQVVSIQVSRFNIDAIRESEQNRTYTSDSLSIGTYTDNGGNTYDAKGIVQADVVVYKQELTANAIVRVSIEEFQKEPINNQKFTNEYIWNNNWARYNGDKRALPNNILDLSNKDQQTPPTPQEIFIMLTEPLLNPVSNYIKSNIRN
ncbi:MAG: hypothetical protein PF486_10645 [Prolixibacteraceae bacterium]|jgi:tetratricopeptide (TPR) repeat protein|nr:hypothetical protein [Prolixibacteraceae bacterium]